jgi:hypothetical protein
MANRVNDRELLKLINRHLDAEQICKIANITLKTLQTRVAKLTYKNLIPHPSNIAGLYKPTSRMVRLNQNSIIIPKTKLEGSAFDTGDRFEISFDKQRIVLTKAINA